MYVNKVITYQMDYHQIKRVISEKTFKESSFLQDEAKLKALMQGLNKMQINSEAFKIIRIVLRFYQFPFMILMRKFYQRMQKEDKLTIIENYETDLRWIGSLVKKILGHGKFNFLQFYLTSGYDNEIIQKFDFKPSQSMLVFMDFVQKIDKMIDQIKVDDRATVFEDIVNVIDQYLQQKHCHLLEKLCLDAYKEITLSKKKMVASELKGQPQRKMFQKNFTQIQTQSGQIIKDKQAAQQFLCCRTFFYNCEMIPEAQTLTVEFKNYDYPYNKFLNSTLMKTICGFLNGQGGIIYIGIKQSMQLKKRVVVGQFYNESVKEDILKHFRYLGQRISPEIVNNSLYKLEFVPIKDNKPNYNYIGGKYIIRLRIKRGLKKELYSFFCYDNSDKIAFRTENEVLCERIGQRVLELYRAKLTNPEDKVQNIHEGSCRVPELGRPLYDHYYYRIQSLNHQSDNKDDAYLHQARKDSNPSQKSLGNKADNNCISHNSKPANKIYKPVKHQTNIFSAFAISKKEWDQIKSNFSGVQVEERENMVIVEDNKQIAAFQAQMDMKFIRMSTTLRFDNTDSSSKFKQVLQREKILYGNSGLQFNFTTLRDVLAAYLQLTKQPYLYQFLTK